MKPLAEVAREIESHLESAGFTERPEIRQALALAEEAGEFVGATRRFLGMARRSGTRAEMEAELADVVITAFVTAVTLGIDLDAAIERKVDVVMFRGWREEPPCGFDLSLGANPVTCVLPTAHEEPHRAGFRFNEVTP